MFYFRPTFKFAHLSDTMKAARYYGREDLRVEEVPEPQAGEGEVLVEVEWCGICGSDLHEYIAGIDHVFLSKSSCSEASSVSETKSNSTGLQDR